MRIKSLEYENFRNFKDRGKIVFSTDGKVTIIYGKNGDGKTTLHQLFQWVFYGKVHFNRTTTERLFNLRFEADQEPGSEFDVMGRIEFVHAGVNYALRRTATYSKSLIGETQFRREELELQKRDEDNNWKHVDHPEETIEKLLPVGLAEYFFFDGESMIADLRVKGDDSAKKLRAALFSMFDLDILDMAIDHIGATNLKKTVLGKLYLSKGDAASGGEISIVRTNIENVQAKIEQLKNKLASDRAEKDLKKQAVRNISEQIGNTKSRAEYERLRRNLQKQRDLFQKNVEAAQVSFGDEVVEAYPRLLISKAVKDAKEKIHLKIDNSFLPTGLGKALINYLLNDSTKNCICGNPLCSESRDHIRAFLDLLPPKSFASLYQEFSGTAQHWGMGYDREKLEGYIRQVLENGEQVESCDERIREIDAEQKKSADIEELVIARQQAEARIEQLDEQITEASKELSKANIYLKKQMSEFDRLSKDDQKTQDAVHKIELMEAVLQNFTERLSLASDVYSRRLEDSIQELLNCMLTSKRKVSVSSDFAVKVFDSFADESKSEGQFAIVSFAYIGGILKMLKSEKHLADKEYPLVLDGPFSKLDPDQRQNVVDVIPQFAPQVILFSKDGLQEIFQEEQIGRVWTIVSNDEKNIAYVKEGYLWN